MIALGGGAVLSEATRTALRERAVCVLLDVEPGVAWNRVRGSGRPLAQAGEAGLAADPFFDMATALRRLLVEDAFVGFSVLSTPTEEALEP